jgi:hypothetical protein
MGEEEALGARPVAVADLAKHPAYGLVNEVFAIADQNSRERERVLELAQPDEMECRHNRDASAPQIARASEHVERFARTFLEVRADDLARGAVDQVPIVDVVEVRDV